MSTTSNEFCHQCYAHGQYIRRLLKNGLSNENLLKASFEFSNLQLLAQSERRLILERYARQMKNISRRLSDRQLSDENRKIYENGVMFSNQCAGINRERCVEMRFDKLLNLEQNLVKLAIE